MPEPKRETQEGRPSQSSNGSEPRIGVYTCYCGGNIGDVVDVEAVASALSELPNVIVSRTDASACSDAGQAVIEDDIREHKLNRIVIGSCSPFLHEQTFRGTLVRAGLNPYLYQHVGIREQDSWVSHDDPEGATAKAIRLLRAGIAKARLLESLDPIRLKASKHALVIGGGVAGLRSALDLARRGLRVTLVEKTPFLGGRMAQLETMFPTDQPARRVLQELLCKVIAHPNVTAFTNTEVVGFSGFVGDFNVTLRQTSRGVSGDTDQTMAAIDACPVEVPDEFNYGLTTRRAIYRRYPGCIPSIPAIDWEHCTRCGECLEVHPDGIELDTPPKEFDVNVGAMVIATGFRPYEPHQGEYGFGEDPRVITLPQFVRLLALSEGSPTLTWDGQPVRDVAMIHCVGSRQIEGVHEPQPDGAVNPYCSRVCCTATLSATNELKERYPEVNVYDVYQDIRTYGRGHEDIYRQAAEAGVRFLRYLPEEGLGVEQAEPDDPWPVLVKVKDTLTWGQELELPVDLVVLAVGMMPNPVDDLCELLKITPGSDRFLLEVHPKLRPVETAVNGIVLAGTAQSPMNIQESCASAEAAAAKVSALLSRGRVELEPFVARVDLSRCEGSGACVEVCEYEGAIRLEPFSENGSEGVRAVVSPANCVGCGVCVGACPNRALDIQGWTLAQFNAMVEAIATETPLLEVEA
jgi:heterodisulfide reductase subunit A